MHISFLVPHYTISHIYMAAAQLVDMGFGIDESKIALEASNNNLEGALQLLLTQASFNERAASGVSNANSQPPPPPPNLIPTVADLTTVTDTDTDFKKALKMSVQQSKADNGKRQQAAVQNFTARTRSAAQNKAAEAAQSRTTNSSDTTTTTSLSPASAAKKAHPNLKIPEVLSKKPKEEQIKRSSKRLSPHPLAIDTLLRTITMIQQNPTNPKYRRIDRNHKAFENALKNAPGAIDLLIAVGFKTKPQNILLLEGQVDLALLYLGKSSLEVARESAEYSAAKAEMIFNTKLTDIANGISTSSDVAVVEREEKKRLAFLKKCPEEPGFGQVSVINILVGTKQCSRRFSSDDVLDDLLNYLGGIGCILYAKIVNEKVSERSGAERSEGETIANLCFRWRVLDRP